MKTAEQIATEIVATYTSGLSSPFQRQSIAGWIQLGIEADRAQRKSEKVDPDVIAQLIRDNNTLEVKELAKVIAAELNGEKPDLAKRLYAAAHGVLPHEVTETDDGLSEVRELVAEAILTGEVN